MDNPIEKQGRISRRTFLKTLGAGVVAGRALTSGWFRSGQQPVEVVFGEGSYRGTPGGQISRSLDQGQTWQPLVNFGPQYSVASLYVLDRQIFARLVVSGHPFWLTSVDAVTWRTVS